MADEANRGLSQAEPYRLTIRRRVSDFSSWQRTVEERLGALGSGGILRYQLCRIVDDPSELEMVLYFNSAEDARELARRLDLPESHERMLLAGAMEIGSMWLAETVIDRRFD